MDVYLLVKWLHIISSTVLFGFGAGTAWYLWNAHLTRDAALIAKVGRMVVRADWIFTGTSGVVQPASGIMLVHLAAIRWASRGPMPSMRSPSPAGRRWSRSRSGHSAWRSKRLTPAQRWGRSIVAPCTCGSRSAGPPSSG